jgi:hypothetical protein
MKAQLPALLMLLSEFRKPVQAADHVQRRAIQPGRSIGLDPTPAVGEAGVPDSAGASSSVYGSAPPHEVDGLKPPIVRGSPWARSKKKRFG